MTQDIFKRIENSKKPEFSDVLSKSFDLYKKYFKQGLMHSLVAFAVMIPLMLVVYIPIIPLYAEIIQNSGNTTYQPSIFENYSATAIVGFYLLIFIASFFMQAVNMSVYGHFFRLLKNFRDHSLAVIFCIEHVMNLL